MNRKLGRFLSDRLKEARSALAKIEEKTLELQIALETCEDESTREALEEGLRALATRMFSIAAAAQAQVGVGHGGYEDAT